MQKIYIKKQALSDGHRIYVVPALPLKNSKNNVKLTIPHPNGTTTMRFETLEEAIAAVESSGFEFVLPEGESAPEKVKTVPIKSGNNLEQMLYSKISSMVNNININVVASALQGLDILENKKAIEIFLDKLGEDNEAVRMAAISGLAKYKDYVVDDLIDALQDTNWVKRNSAITCLVMISEVTELDAEKIIVPIINRIDDTNPIVQSNAIIAVSKIYRNSIKQME